jgi:hypothetical protein
MADIEAPSLPLLAGLARGEYPQARELFDLVLEELVLLPLALDDLAEARWIAARWWAGRIVACQLDPVHGAKLIFEEAAAELGHPDVLQPVVDLAAGLDLSDERPADLREVREQVTSAAREFVAVKGTPIG